MTKIRLDQLLVERGLAESRERAQALLMAGLVWSGEQRLEKPGHKVDASLELTMRGQACPYVSRGGLKLEAALDHFGLRDLRGVEALDLGASTGGFTDCMLARGAARVWAFDVGHGQLHPKLRDDPRVVVRERVNARELEPSWLGGARPSLVTIDVSFISLKLVLPPVAPVLASGGSVVALIKPQFEADRRAVRKGGVVRDRAVHRQVLEGMLGWSRAQGWRVLGLCLSPLAGPAGNREVFIRLDRAAEAAALPDAPGAVAPENDKNAVEVILREIYNEVSPSVPGASAVEPGWAAARCAGTADAPAPEPGHPATASTAPRGPTVEH